MGKVKIESLDCELIDSFEIESSNIIRFLSYDEDVSCYLFLEENTNNLILFYPEQKRQEILSNLKDRFPEFQNRILAANLSNSELFVISTQGYFKYSFTSDSILYNKTGLIAQIIPSTLSLSKHNDEVLTNLTLYHSLSREEFKKFSYAKFDSKGNIEAILADTVLETWVPDIRKYISFTKFSGMYSSYLFPYEKVFFGNIDSLTNGSKLKSIIIDTEFLKAHPYYKGEKYSLEDFRYIPVVYKFHATDSHFLMNLNEGGNRESEEYDGSRLLLVFDRNGALQGKYNLPFDLDIIQQEITTNTFLFSVVSKAELPEKTIFKVAHLNLKK